MLIFGEFFKTQYDQKIHQNAQNAPYFQNFPGELAYAPEPPSICVQL